MAPKAAEDRKRPGYIRVSLSTFGQWGNSRAHKRTYRLVIASCAPESRACARSVICDGLGNRYRHIGPWTGMDYVMAVPTTPGASPKVRSLRSGTQGGVSPHGCIGIHGRGLLHYGSDCLQRLECSGRSFDQQVVNQMLRSHKCHLGIEPHFPFPEPLWRTRAFVIELAGEGSDAPDSVQGVDEPHLVSG